MRAMIISDIHGLTNSLVSLARLHDSVDLIFIAGDITDFGEGDDARGILAPLTIYGCPIVAVSGNCDRDSVRSFLNEAGYSVEGQSRSICGLRIAGAGGGIRRQGGLTPFEPTEDELESSLREALAEPMEPTRPLVVITHSPPAGTNLDRRGSSHVGSLAFGAMLSEYVPNFWISGHIHESRSIGRKGSTTLINPGSFNDGYYAMAELEIANNGLKVRAELHRLGDLR